LGWIVRRILFSTLARWAKDIGQMDDILVRSIRGLYDLGADAGDPPRSKSPCLQKSAVSSQDPALSLGCVLTVAGAKLASAIVKAYGTRMQGALPVTSLTQNMVQIAVIVISILILLNSLGMSITPLLTALG
jgi:small-conductance mechanosensitive channel